MEGGDSRSAHEKLRHEIEGSGYHLNSAPVAKVLHEPLVKTWKLPIPPEANHYVSQA